MKERPILFNDEMVRALLDGRKTQTRRLVKMPRTRDAFVLEDRGQGWWPYQSDDGESSLCNDGNEHPYRCPYGDPGDQLWVREAHGYEIRSVGGTPHEQITYRASNPAAVRCYDCNGMEQPMKWRPSIHMPRWASRITLEIVSVRVERLQEISADDAASEGISIPVDGQGNHLIDVSSKHSPVKFLEHVDEGPDLMLKAHFASLWESINGAGSWEANPWVWVVEFRRDAP